ncbi:hypothetical protein F4824DRAFT_502633 [Ustulina deusta]|nr:hypothetical protein F4824DRAFT_502633 [Ustulina deusta]
MQRAHHLAAVPFVSLLPQTFAKWLIAKNECPFEIWCAGAKNDRTFTPSSLVLPGQMYWSQLTADNDNIGAVLKCALNPQVQQPYQMEVNVQYGLSWLDLSAIDGDPFLAYHRHAEINWTETIYHPLYDNPLGYQTSPR